MQFLGVIQHSAGPITSSQEIAAVMKMVNPTQYGQDILGVVPQVGGSESELEIEISLQPQVTSMFVNVGG